MVICAAIVAGCSSAKPYYSTSEGSKEYVFETCDQLALEISDVKTKFDKLKTQKTLVVAGNSINMAGAALSFNPFAMLDHTRTGELDEVIIVFQQKVEKLDALAVAQKCIIPAM